MGTFRVCASLFVCFVYVSLWVNADGQNDLLHNIEPKLGKNFLRRGFLKAPISYYPNSCATFSLSLICCGDVKLNRGPETVKTYSSDSRHVNHTPRQHYYSSEQLTTIGLSSNVKVTLSLPVRDNIKQLGIQRHKPRTHRGCRAGKRKQKYYRNTIPTIINQVERRPPLSQPRESNAKNLIKIRTVPTRKHNIPQLPTVFLCNPRSANNKFDELCTVILENDADICGITETWYKHDLPAQLVSIPGYALVTKSRVNRIGGGVALYAKHDIYPSQPSNVSVPDDLEVT